MNENSVYSFPRDSPHGNVWLTEGPVCHLAGAPLTLADVPGVIGSCHPSLLVVTWATAIAALTTRVVLTFAAELLCEKQREDGRVAGF